MIATTSSPRLVRGPLACLACLMVVYVDELGEMRTYRVAWDIYRADCQTQERSESVSGVLWKLVHADR